MGVGISNRGRRARQIATGDGVGRNRVVKTGSQMSRRIREPRIARPPAGYRRIAFTCWVGLVTAMLGVGSAANSASALIDIAIVEPFGRPGHQGFFPIQGQPIVGGFAIVQSRMDSAANGMTLNVRGPGGILIGQAPMITPPAANLWPVGIYFAQFQVPTIPFGLSVSGTDQSGNSFEIPPPGQARVI